MTSRCHSANTRASLQKTDSVTWVGSSCGRHGSYVFYKAIRFHITSGLLQPASSSSVAVRSRTRERRSAHADHDVTKKTDDRADDVAELSNRDFVAETRILALGEFFFVQCRPEDPICVGELQLLWHDKHSGQDLASTRLYYLPETTPAGRTSHHGQDEVLAVSEKVIMRTNDLVSWIVEPDEWFYGSKLLVLDPPGNVVMKSTRAPFERARVNMADVTKEKSLIAVNGFCAEHRINESRLKNEEEEEADPTQDLKPGLQHNASPEKANNLSVTTTCANCAVRFHKAGVIVTSITAYCRHRAMLKRIEGTNPDWLTQPQAGQWLALLGVYTSDNPKTRLVFCRDTFDYPQLFEHDLICEELAPVFKGRPRKKPKKANGQNIVRGQGKKVVSDGDRTCEIVEGSDKISSDDLAVNRRSSGRRRSKRRWPQQALYEEQFQVAFSRPAKKGRRGTARTPTPVSDVTVEKVASGSKSEPTSPSAEENTDINLSPSASTSKRRSKRRPGSKAKNNLLIIHKDIDRVDSTEDKESEEKSPGSSSSGSSSRSSTPSPSSSLSNRSNELYGEPSPKIDSPVDFNAMISAVDGLSEKRDIDIPTSEANMYLRGLSEGNVPETKAAFLELLHQFMRKRNTPIGRIPSLGFKKLDLWAFFKLSQEYGGYNMVTAKRLWKHVYDRMGGNPSCTSAATCTRKHFEKLLLPLEMYLRQTIRKKEADVIKTKTGSDDVIKTPKSEVSTTQSQINGRTFDGEVYFHNGAKIAATTGKSEACKTAATETKRSNHTETSQPVEGGQKASEINTKPVHQRAVINNMASVVSAAPFVNFESLAHSVIHDELLADRTNKLKTPQGGEEEELSADEKTISINEHKLKSDDVDDVIDLTDTKHDASLNDLPLINPLKTQRPTSSGSKSLTPSSLTSTHPTSRSTILNPVFTRTHCPRMTIAPPPFVPTKSSAALKVNPTEKNHVTNPGFLESGRTNQTDVMTDLRKEERANLQKRRIPDSSSNLDNPNLSPTSPKKLRPSPVHATHSSSVGNFAMHNLLSTSDNKNTSRQHKPSHSSLETCERYSSYLRPPHSKAETRTDRFNCYPSQTQPNEIRYPVIKDRLLGERKDSVNPGIYQKLPLHRSPEALTKHSPVNHRAYDVTNPQKTRTYYRPTGMLAGLKQQPRTSETPQNGQFKQERTADCPTLSIPSSRPSLPVNGVGRPQSPRSRSDFAQPVRSVPSPKLLPQHADERKHFSSNFSVDRLTSDPDKRPALAKQEFIKKEAETPSVSRPYLSSQPLHATDHRVYRPPAEKDSYKAPFPRKEDHPPRRPDRSQWNLNKEPLNGLSRPPAPRISTASSDAPLPSLLDSIHPALRPYDCSPQALERLMQDTIKAMTLHTGGGPAPLLAGVPMPQRGMHEALLRQQMLETQQHPFSLISHQEQQAVAAAQLAQAAAVLGSQAPSSVPAPMEAAALAQLHMLYARAAAVAPGGGIRQFQDHPVTVNNPALAKPPGNMDLLNNHFSRFAAPQMDMRTSGLLSTAPQVPQQVTPEMMAAFAAISYGGRR